MPTTTLKITGMMCQACVGHVTKALESVPGVTHVAVDLEPGRAIVQHDGADLETITEAVAEEGYEAEVEKGE